MKKLWGNLSELLKDLRDSMKMPSFTIFSIMMVYSFVEIFLFVFTGDPLPSKEIMYIILLTWLPFILGNKVSTKTFENNEVVILLLLTTFLALAGVTLKSKDFPYEFHGSIYIIALIFAFLWMLIDFKYLNKIREQRYKEKMKTNTNKVQLEFNDGMAVDE